MQLGYHDLPAGTLAALVTSLRMTKKPVVSYETEQADLRLELLSLPDLERYRDIFRRVGQEWLWWSRLAMSDEELSHIIHNPNVEVRVLSTTNGGMGLLELDFREHGSCELVFFGLSQELIGKGVGRWLMNKALEIAWSHPIKSLWVHTCSLDHPLAVNFYQRSGFIPFDRKIEVMRDPRIAGILPLHVASHIPLIIAA